MSATYSPELDENLRSPKIRAFLEFVASLEDKNCITSRPARARKSPKTRGPDPARQSYRRDRDFRVLRKFTRQPVNEHPHTYRELPPVRIEERYRRRRGPMLRKHFDESAGRKVFGNVILRHLNEAKP